MSPPAADTTKAAGQEAPDSISSTLLCRSSAPIVLPTSIAPTIFHGAAFTASDPARRSRHRGRKQ
jgi:hypothetical protein